MTRARIPMTQLFTLADRQLVTLPKDITAGRVALQRLLDHVLPLGTNPAELHERAVAELVAGARSGEDLLTRVSTAEAEADDVSRRQAQMVLEDARQRVQAELTEMLQDQRDELITDVLAPAHDKVIAEAADLAPLLNEADVSSVIEMARADARTRKARIRIEELAADYSAIRDAWSRLFEMAPTASFGTQVRIFGTVADPAPAGFRPGAVNNVQGMVVPWPAETVPRLLWLARHRECKPWLPTPAQHDARVEDVYAVQLAALRRGQAGKMAVKAWAGR